MELSNRFKRNSIILIFLFLITYNENLISENHNYLSSDSTIIENQDYIYIFSDSIKVINSMMRYHLDFIKFKLEFEKPTFEQKKDRTYTLKQLYDSLSQLYLPFEVNTTIKSIWYEGGLNSMNWFLVDSNTIYTLWIFIPDSLFLNSSLLQKMDTTSQIGIDEILKFEDFGVLAYKDGQHIQKLRSIYSDSKNADKDDLYFQEYLRLLKEFDRRKNFELNH